MLVFGGGEQYRILLLRKPGYTTTRSLGVPDGPAVGTHKGILKHLAMEKMLWLIKTIGLATGNRQLADQNWAKTPGICIVFAMENVSHLGQFGPSEGCVIQLLIQRSDAFLAPRNGDEDTVRSDHT